MALNWTSIITSALGLGGSLFGGNSQAKQMAQMQRRQQQMAENYLNAQNAMWMPYVDAGRNALAATKAFTNEQNALRYQDDRLAGIARDRSLAAAYQTTARNNANINAAFANNAGRALGSQMRNQRAGNEAITSANFNWALQNRQAQTQATNNYLQGLTSLNNAGYTGTNAMTQAYNNYTQLASQANQMGAGAGRGSAWQDIGGMLLGIGMSGFLDTSTGDVGEWDSGLGGPVEANKGAATTSAEALPTSLTMPQNSITSGDFEFYPYKARLGSQFDKLNYLLDPFGMYRH